MFHRIPAEIKSVMQMLESRDESDKQDGTPWERRLRQIPPETGQFIALLTSMSPPGGVVEVGTSGGYSTLWLYLAACEPKRTIVTIENDPFKVSLAMDTFRSAGIASQIQLVHSDARRAIAQQSQFSFSFLDCDQVHYAECYEQIISRLPTGGILAADNALTHRDMLGSFLKRVEEDSRVDSLTVPIGAGVLLCRRL